MFIAQFFNTGILLLLVNANMTEHSPKFITQYISSGKFYDYVPMWYQQVGGTIVKSMIINSIMPYITLTTTILIPKMKRFMDKCGVKKPKKKKSKKPGMGGIDYRTKKTSMAAYKALYSGGDYIIDFKYSNVLNIIYITMMYGIGMPILFPVAVFNFLNQYICERIMVAYYMKQPPALDDLMIRNCIRMIRWAPLFFLGNGYWMASNRQIFQNSYSFVNKHSDVMKSGHFFKFTPNDSAMPLMLMFMANFALIIIMIFGYDWIRSLGFTLDQQDIEPDEDLPNFF